MKFSKLKSKFSSLPIKKVLLIIFSFVIPIIIGAYFLPNPDFVGGVYIKSNGTYGSNLSGTAFYIGHGIVVTNWHNSTATYGLLNSNVALKPEDQLLKYWIGSPYENLKKSFVCSINPNEDLFTSNNKQYFLSDSDKGDCIAMNRILIKGFRPSKELISSQISIIPFTNLIYLNRDYDIALVKINENDLRGLNMSKACLSSEIPQNNEIVTIRGHAAGLYPEVLAHGTIKIATAQMLVDPDPNDSNLVRYSALSMVIHVPQEDVRNIYYGSSGSPVFNSKNEVIGTVWTTTNTDEYIPASGNGKDVYVTPVSAWLKDIKSLNINNTDLKAALKDNCL